MVFLIVHSFASFRDRKSLKSLTVVVPVNFFQTPSSNVGYRTDQNSELQYLKFEGCPFPCVPQTPEPSQAAKRLGIIQENVQ